MVKTMMDSHLCPIFFSSIEYQYCKGPGHKFIINISTLKKNTYYHSGEPQPITAGAMLGRDHQTLLDVIRHVVMLTHGDRLSDTLGPNGENPRRGMIGFKALLRRRSLGNLRLGGSPLFCVQRITVIC